MSFDVDPRDRMIAALKGQIATYREQSVLDAITLGDKDAEIERLQTIAENAEALRRNLEDVSCCRQNEIERLRDAYHILKRDYDALREELTGERRDHEATLAAWERVRNEL